MSKSYAARSSEAPTTSMDVASNATSMSNSDALASMNAGGTPRDRNLPFKFDRDALIQLKPAELAQRMYSRLLNEESQGQKDGVVLTDMEKLYVAVEMLVAAGYKDTALNHKVTQLFFEPGNQAKGRDHVERVRLQGGSVVVEFDSPGGHFTNPGPILPLIADAPVRYTGRDNNARGAVVRGYQRGGKLPRAGSWLQRMDAQMKAGFLTSEGKGFATMDATTRDADPAFREAYWDWQQDRAVDYMIWGKRWILDRMAPVEGRSPGDVADEAMGYALGFTARDAYAVPHTTIETQDEAIVQAALEELGVSLNVDTDNVGASMLNP